MKKISLIWIPVIALMGLQFIFLCSCEKEKEELPGLTTGKITKITDNSACCCGLVNQEGSSDVWERGICWCCDKNPTKMDGFTLNTKDTGAYECALTGLLPNTTYYVRAFASNSEGTAYGNEINFKTPPTVTDIDGNVYHTVIIGDQVWMAENLRVTKYRNGDQIPNVLTMLSWASLTTGAWVELDEQFNKGYGKLYNFYAVSDIRLLAPEGWHVATDAEWKVLTGTVDSQFHVGDPVWESEGYLGSDAGGNLKSTTDQWNQPNIGAADKFGFTALPGGYMDWESRGFQAYDAGTRFWTSTAWNGTQSWYWAIFYDENGILRKFDNKQDLASVRCVKD